MEHDKINTLVKLELNLVELNKHGKQTGSFTFTYNKVVIGQMKLYWQTPENIFFKVSLDSNKDMNQLSEMIYLCMCYVFEELKIHKLSCEIINDKTNNIEIYYSQGFEREGIFKQHQQIDSKYYDVYRLSCLRNNFIKYLKSHNLKVLKGQKSAINVGDTYREEMTLTNKGIIKFSEVSGDINPLHLDSQYAIKNGFKTNIVHGMLSASIFSKILGTEFPGNGSIYISQDLMFLQPIYPNEKILVELKILSIIGTKYIIRTQIKKEGLIALEGIAKVIKN